MSTDRDVDRIVRSWLGEDRHEDADRVLNTVLDQLDTTPQRGPLRAAWRRFAMNNTIRIGVAAAAVLVALFVGAQLVGQANVIGPPAETPSPSAAPSLSSTPSVAGNEWPAAGLLEPGTRYRVAMDAFALTFAVPTTGWNSDGAFFINGHAGSPEETELWFYATDLMGGSTPAVFADPCSHEGAIEFEDSLAGEAEAWGSVPGTEVADAPTDVIVDGRAAKSVVVVVPEDVGCTNTNFWLIYDPSCERAARGCSTYPTWLGETLRIWIVDVGNGERVTIRFDVRFPDASPDLEREIQEIVDSIQFE